MVLLFFEPCDFYYDLEQKVGAAIQPRPAFLPVLRMLNGVVESPNESSTFLSRKIDCSKKGNCNRRSPRRLFDW